MQHHSDNENIFIRSMVLRGYKGGLSRVTGEVAIVLDAMGFEIIFIETIGIGQNEIDISKLALSTGIINIPGSGDDIQTVKAGIIETGDIFIVNKSDKSGADDAVTMFKMMIELRDINQNQWIPRVIKTSVVNNNGFKDLVNVFMVHYKFMEANGILDKKKKTGISLF